MRRLPVRGHENVLKRLLIQVSAFNLGMLMLLIFGRCSSVLRACSD